MPRDDINPADYVPGTIMYHHPDHCYHQAPGLSSGQVKTFALQSARHFHWRYVLEQAPRKETDAMLLGTLVHCLVLEPDDFEKRYEQELQLADYPQALNKVDELKRYCKEQGLPVSGTKQELASRILEQEPDAPIWEHMLSRQRESKRRIVKPEQWDKARRMRDGVLDNPDAAALFAAGHPEVSVWASHEPTGQLVKCRADWLRADGICADLKTCACSSPSDFARDCAKFGYDLQEVHYTTTLAGAGVACQFFCFVAIESEPPHLCQVYELNDRSRQLALGRYEAAMKAIAECRTLDDWPGYAEPLSTLSLPAWHLKTLERFS